MKLVEIFNTELSQADHPKQALRNKSRRPDYGMDKDIIGHGAMYTAKRDRNDPHMVDKHSIHADSSENTPRFSKDGMQLYAEAIIKGELAQSNPFFPRFYGYHIDKDEGGNKFYSLKTEKLHDSDDKKIKSIPFKAFVRNIVKDVFTDKEERDLFLRTFKEEVEDAPKEEYYNLFTEDIGWYLGEMIDNGRFGAASDKLNEALKLIYEIIHENGLSNDLHGSNIMYRLGPHGIQLVINDPIA